MSSHRSRVHASVAAVAAGLLVSLALSAPGPAAAATTRTEAQQIIRIARAQTGDPFRMGAVGPRSFDCSGLVLYAYKAAGDGRVIRSDRLRSARQIYQSFKARGLADRSSPKVGDLVIWGGGSHIGIYVGGGKAISALESGVRVHRITSFSSRFTAYLHTGMSTKLAG